MQSAPLCQRDGCSKPSQSEFTWTEGSVAVGVEQYCLPHAKLMDCWRELDDRIFSVVHSTQARQFEIHLVYTSSIQEENLLYLHEVGGDGLIPISMGIWEASNIAWKLKRHPSPRPLTHTAMFNAITSMGGVTQDVIIYDLQDNIYYAHLRICQNGSVLNVDMRPSDAISTALVADIPILVSTEVLALYAETGHK